MTTFGEKTRELMTQRGISLRKLAAAANYDAGYLSKILNGHKPPTMELARQLETVLAAPGDLVEFVPPSARCTSDDSGTDDELDALELSRRAAASDIGTETLHRLELAVDDLATAYPGTPPQELLGRIRKHLAYVVRLMDARKTLSEQRRLLVVGGWLSLLGSTCHIDLRQLPSATARLKTAAQLAKQTEHHELAAWCLETEAWQALTAGDYRRALTLSQGAQALAPRNGSAFIQAVAQEGRVWARLGAAQETRDALNRVARLVSPLPMPDRPEHHYRYDPAKSDAYVATTLSWLGDPAAEPYARQVLARLESATDGPPRPRRAVSARLDLALALMAADQADEAGHLTLSAITSGLLVPSNYWRAREVIAAVAARRLPETAELREAYRELSDQPELTA
ncbi:XRE family transcriptional regulator [Nonomuraea longispora]|uniref:XRE family transcriptional regulator n=1 Tax=Nonomuraea longispora TaxID=1848320 RepID=A0A4R4MHA0_9ACTN|nr:helix-turn-helix domain-containing protein [Nonomuraea longispora]TDB93096.1 XRE family transcriptional regulator [Nonomuraea longispora]